MATDRDLRQRAGEIFDKADSILETANEENRSLTAEEEEKYDSLFTEASGLVEQARDIEDRRENHRELRETLERSRERVVRENPHDREVRDFANIPDEDRHELQKRAFIKNFRNQTISAIENTGIPFNARKEELSDEERAAMRYTAAEYRGAGQQSTTAGSGGQFIPQGFRNEIVQAMEAYGGMRRVASVIATDSGNDLPWPTSDDTQNEGSLVAEATTGGSTHVPTSSVTLKAWKYKTGPIRASLEILQDSAFDMESFLRSNMAERIGRITEKHFAGTTAGTAKPQGLRNLSTGAVTLVQGTGLTPEKLIDLTHTVDVAYRDAGAWMMHDKDWQEITKLRVGSSDEFLINRNFTEGFQRRLLGYPVVINNSLPTSAYSSTNSSATKPYWFGDFSYYKIRDVRDLSVVRLNERFILEGNIGFIGFSRHDGRAVFGSTRAANRPIRCILATTA